MKKFSVLVIAEGNLLNKVVAYKANLPFDGDTVLLDYCPKNTEAVYSFSKIKEAASFANVSVSTAYRQAKKYREMSV